MYAEFHNGGVQNTSLVREENDYDYYYYYYY